MKCVRFEDLRTGNKRIGFIDGDVIRCVYGSLETYWQITDETFAMRDVRLLAPCVPKQIICVSFNYQKHAAEFGVEIPREPSIFSKAAHTVVGTGADIIWPKQVQELAFGAELGIVVKKRMKNVKAEDVPKYILGYTCANDVTARDLQRKERQWLRCKSFDTFCPLGPWLETELDPSDLSIRSYVNGVQSGHHRLLPAAGLQAGYLRAGPGLPSGLAAPGDHPDPPSGPAGLRLPARPKLPVGGDEKGLRPHGPGDGVYLGAAHQPGHQLPVRLPPL